MSVSSPHSNIEQWAKKDVEEKREIFESLKEDIKELKKAKAIEQEEGSEKSVRDLDLLIESVYWIGRQINRGEKIDKELVKDEEARRDKQEILKHLESELTFNFQYLYIFEEVSEELATTIADVEKEDLNRDKEEVEKLLQDVARKVNKAEEEVKKEIETEEEIIQNKFDAKVEEIVERAKENGEESAEGFISER